MEIRNPFKEMNLNVPSLLLGGFAGLTAGGAGAYLVLRKSMVHRFSTALDEEVAAIKADYNDKLKQALSGIVRDLPTAGAPFVGRSAAHLDLGGDDGDGDDGKAALGNGIDPLEGLDGYYGTDDGDPGGPGQDEEAAVLDEDRDLVQPDPAADAPLAQDRMIGIERDIRFPYMITEDEFGDSPPGWQQITLTYFASGGTLVDDKNEPIPNYRKIVGKIRGPQDFGGVSGDPHLRYVRNQEMETDFEIVLDARSYADGILNYGQPNRGS